MNHPVYLTHAPQFHQLGPQPVVLADSNHSDAFLFACLFRDKRQTLKAGYMRLTIQGHSLLRPREVVLSTTEPASGDRRRTDTFPSFYFRCSVVFRTGLIINASRSLQQLGAKHRQGDTGGKVRVMHGNG